jgi:type II secretory pathway pseudopilin PulG
MVQKLLSGILIYYYFNNMLKSSNYGFTRLEKLMNNILVLKVIRIIKKLLYFKKKNLGVSLTGFTLLEAMMVIVIIGIMSVFFVVNTRPNQFALLRMDTTRLAADIRYIRSMATTRAAYNGSYPADGYGIIFYNKDGSINKSYYELYAGSNLLKTVYLANVAFRFVDPNLEYPTAINITTPKKFFFKTENKVVSDLTPSASGEYKIDIYYAYVVGAYYKSQITIGQKTSDEFTWSNLATTYDTNNPVCGNGVVELGEECERYENQLDSKFTVQDPDCLLPPNCRYNKCGDGIILGEETCETNWADEYHCSLYGVSYQFSSCSYLNVMGTCSKIDDITSIYYDDDGDGFVDTETRGYINKKCCPSNRYFCLDCKINGVNMCDGL